MTDHENLHTGAERIFAVYVKCIADPDPLFTGSADFLTDHALKIAVFSRDRNWCKTAASACQEVGIKSNDPKLLSLATEASGHRETRFVASRYLCV